MSFMDLPARAAPLDPYSLWNAKLLETFFSSACQGEEVWLQVDGDELDLIGPELGGEEGFLKAVRAGPAWQTFTRNGKLSRGDSADLVSRVRGLVRQRLYPADKPTGYIDPGELLPEYRGSKAPTYLPFLAALVRSSALASRDGYYKHLRDALQLPSGWNSLQLAQLEIAWDDLQCWTKETNGRFGRFVPRRLGGHAHVGLPRAQCIMSRQDCEASGRVFELVGLRPGQAWSEAVARDVISCAQDVLSASFRDALGYKELRGPVEASLRSLFEEWDGTVETSSHQGDGKHRHQDLPSYLVELALSPHDGEPRWQVHWRVPPVREGSDVVLERNGASWRAPVWGTDRCSTASESTASAVEASRAALDESAIHDVHFQAWLEEDGSKAAPLGKFELPRAELRVLVWGIDYASQREELQEHLLPRHGYAYLLGTKRVARELVRWLEREEVEHEIIDANGLPGGWVLACVTDCRTLNDEQLARLPGTVGTNRDHRLLSIIGGRSVSRASKRQYLSYDLPFIELDAPPGTTLQSDAALFLEESRTSAATKKPSVRRFRISLGDTAQKSFRISAVHGTTELASVTLRIAPDSGEQVTLGRNFSLDPQGRPQGMLSGLRGALPNGGEGVPAKVTPLVVDSDLLGDRLGALAALKATSNPAVLFLDSLARHGSMAYGTAKDQLYRLLATSGEALRPENVLLDLRCRGHIEIETSTRGHFTRIHAVPPALYQLPLLAGGRPVHGILGSLLVQQWRSLFEKAAPATILQAASSAGLLPTWRILASDPAGLDRIASACGVDSLPIQATQVASWAATCDEVRAQIEQGAVESIGALAFNPHRLHAGSGCFMSVSSLAPQSACDLFRMDDRDIIGGRVYVVAARKENVARYGFVRDSRWGVWIALHAFARFVKDTLGLDDACPWPLPYSAKDGSLLLPARINLPVVLERALVLCSGQAPDVVEAKGRDLDGRCIIVRKSDGKGIAVVSQVYSDMAEGRWLLYRRVPGEIAAIVATKIGAALGST